jgi:hypothetical protein
MLSTLRSEWMKQRRSFALPLVLLAAGFVPSILLLVRLVKNRHFDDETLWKNAWEAPAILLYPLLLILLTSLIVQIETRNNAWKQLHASPQSLYVIYFCKLLVILARVATFFLFALLFTRGVHWQRCIGFFVDGLPIVALQLLLCLHVRNFMAPIGIGMALWLAAIGGLSWRYIYYIPYGYSALDFLGKPGASTAHALTFFAAFVAAGAISYANKADLG